MLPTTKYNLLLNKSTKVGTAVSPFIEVLTELHRGEVGVPPAIVIERALVVAVALADIVMVVPVPNSVIPVAVAVAACEIVREYGPAPDTAVTVVPAGMPVPAIACPTGIRVTTLSTVVLE